jgi:stage V sporulation protein S
MAGEGESAAHAREGHAVDLLRVSSSSNPNSVAGAIAGVVREAGGVEVQVVGAGALNQAIKALAIARSYMAGAGVDLVFVPYFADIEIDGERRTAIRLRIGDRHSPRVFGPGGHAAKPIPETSPEQ